MQHIKDNMSYLKALASLPKRQVQHLLQSSDSHQIHCLVEICHNLIRGVIELPQKELSQLKPHKAVIRKLSKQSTKLKTMRRYLLNKASSVSLLVQTILPTLEKALD